MNRIQELRKLKKITQKELCKILNIAQPTLSGYETNTYEPDFETASNIADFFEVSLDYLLGRTENHDLGNLHVPENLADVPMAFAGGLKDLTQDDLDEVSKFVDFIRSKKNKPIN